MKGIMFTTLNDMVIDKYGFEVWEELLQIVKPTSRGSYTAGGRYPYSELQAIIVALSQIKKIEVTKLLEIYGLYMFSVLAQKYPIFLQNVTLKEFLKSINDVIHLEIKKLHPDADLPTIKYEE